MASINIARGIVQKQSELQGDSGRGQGPNVGEVGIFPLTTISLLLEGPKDLKTAESVDELVEVPLDLD